MKRLTLLRHAKSGWETGVGKDFDRTLNERGRRDARAIGAEMRRLGLAFDRISASPAARVEETLAEASAGYGAALDPARDEQIYLASADTLLGLVAECDDAAASLLLVGHNPGIQTLGARLAREKDAARAEILVKYPTAALAEITLPASRWRDIVAGTGIVSRFIRPADLDLDLGADSDG